MAKITCLKAMFRRKNKDKCTVVEGVENMNSFEREMLSFEANLEKGCCQEHMKDSSTFNAAMKVPVSNTSTLSTAPSMAEWGNEGKVSVWSVQNDPLSSNLMKENTAVAVEYTTVNLNEVGLGEERFGNSGPKKPVNTDAVGEVAYEGGDEDDESAGTAELRELSERSAELAGEDGASVQLLDNETVKYYETQSNDASRSDAGGCQHFSDGEICGDYVSDPGLYNAQDLGLACSPMFLPHHHSSHQSENIGIEDTRSEGRLSEMAITLTGNLVISESCHSGSTAGRSSKDSNSQLLKAGIAIQNSPHSESTLRDGNEMILDVKFSKQELSLQKCKPWWRVFLATHRNIHRDVKNMKGMTTHTSKPGEGAMSNPVTGYGTDIECCSGGISRVFLKGLPPVQYEMESNGASPMKDAVLFVDTSGASKAVDLEEGEIKSENSASLSQVVQPLAVPPSRRMSTLGKGKELKYLNLAKSDLSHVEEWLRSIDIVATAVDEDMEMESKAGEGSDPAAAQAISFSSMKSWSADQLHADGAGLVEHKEHHGDPLMDGDVEMASMMARAVNSSSSVINFASVGLKTVPPLGFLYSLNSLNLSGNAIVRIVPGCLPRSLHSLDLSHNKIAVIEGLRELTRLRVLNLSFNRLSRIGHGLGNCSSLRELNLAGNKISEIEGLHRLLKLNFLDLSINKLTTSKSIGQLAANYSSVQALNLLGNALHRNLGDEPLRKLVTGLTPHILYLNKQAMKAGSTRDAAVDSVARAALGTATHLSHRASKRSGKALRRGGSSLLAAGHTSSRRSRSGGRESVVSGGHQSSVNRGLEKASHKYQHHSHQHSKSVGKGLPAVKDSGLYRIRSDGSLYEKGFGCLPSQTPVEAW